MSWFDKLFGDNGRKSTAHNRDFFLYKKLHSGVFDYIERNGQIIVSKSNIHVDIQNQNIVVSLNESKSILFKDHFDNDLSDEFKNLHFNNPNADLHIRLLQHIQLNIIDSNIKIAKVQKLCDIIKDCIPYSKDLHYCYDDKNDVIYKATIDNRFARTLVFVTKYHIETCNETKMRTIVDTTHLSMQLYPYDDLENLNSNIEFLESLKDMKKIKSLETVWMDVIFEQRALKTIKRNKLIKEHMESVFEYHQKYNDLAYKFESTPAAAIKDYKSYVAFIRMSNIGFSDIRFKSFEIENYLRNIGKYCPN